MAAYASWLKAYSDHDNVLSQDNASLQTNYRALFKEVLDLEVTTKIPRCEDKGLVLGTERCRARVRLLTS
jgi:hypothetical protein